MLCGNQLERQSSDVPHVNHALNTTETLGEAKPGVIHRLLTSRLHSPRPRREHPETHARASPPARADNLLVQIKSRHPLGNPPGRRAPREKASPTHPCGSRLSPAMCRCRVPARRLCRGRKHPRGARAASLLFEPYYVNDAFGQRQAPEGRFHKSTCGGSAQGARGPAGEGEQEPAASRAEAFAEARVQRAGKTAARAGKAGTPSSKQALGRSCEVSSHVAVGHVSN